MSDETKDEYKLFEDKKEEMAGIFGRMDTDEALYLLESYVMYHLPPDDGKKMDDVANVTLNDPLSYATKVIAVIGGMDMKRVVEGRDMTDKQTTKVEQFLEDIFYMIDELLVKRGIPGLDAFINEQISIRGRIGARPCVRLDKEKGLIPDVLPLDTRCFAPHTNEEGMAWGAPWFTRSKAEILRQYPEATWVSEEGEVVDFWDALNNKVFVDKRLAKTNPNTWGYPPFVYVTCPIGSMLNTSRALKHRGESIFWANRDLWVEMSKVASILQTLNINSLFAPMQLESSQPENVKLKVSTYKPKTVHGVEKGTGYKPMPINDIKAATRLLYSVLETRLQRASLAAIDYGTLTFPLSSLAITRLSGSRDDILLPRVDGKALFYQALSRMIINQCIALNTTLHIGKPGSKNEYKKSDLEGDYTINYKFYTISQEQGIANLSIANASRELLSDDTIRRDVLKLKDPDGEKVKLTSERAKKVDEVLFLFDSAYNLVDKDKPTELERMEAEVLMERVETIMKQRRRMGTLSELEGQRTPEPEEQPKGKELLPLVAGGGGQGSPPSQEPEETKEASRE